MKPLSLYILFTLSFFSCTTWTMHNNKRTSSQAFAEESTRNVRQQIAHAYRGTPYQAYASALFSSEQGQENSPYYDTQNSFHINNEKQEIYNSLVAEYDRSPRLENNAPAPITAPAVNDYRQTDSYDAAQVAAFEKTLEESIAHTTKTTRCTFHSATQEKNSNYLDAMEISTIYNRIAQKDRCEQLFFYLVKQTSLGLTMLERIACFAKKELTATEIASICDVIRTPLPAYPDAQANADRMISILQPAYIDNSQNFKDLCQQRLTSTQVESMVNQHALTVPLIHKLIEQGNYCKNMWHILGKRYEAKTLQAALSKARAHFSDTAKKEIFDYIRKNPIVISNDPKEDDQITVAILQTLFSSASPQGYAPLHTLFPVRKLPISAFKKLANTPENRAERLAQGKEIFSRGSIQDIRKAMEEHMHCENALQILTQRSSVSMVGQYSDVSIARLKTHAKNVGYTLN